MNYINKMDMKSIDLNLLRSLDALFAAGSVTGAARSLHISQPAMSAQLARLRTLFGDPLFVASGRKMVPTVRAEGLRAPLGKLLREVEWLVREQVTFNPSAAEETFRLGATDNVHAVFSTGLLSVLQKQAPNTRLALMPFQSDMLWQDLESGRLDAAVVSSFVTLNEAKRLFLLRERFVLVQSKNHPRGSLPPDLDAFCALDHILVSPEGGGFVGAVDQALRKLGRDRKVVASLPSFLLAPALVQSSNLVCVIPERLAKASEAPLHIFPLPFDLAGFEFQLVWHPRRQQDTAHVWFRTVLASLARQLATKAAT